MKKGVFWCKGQDTDCPELISVYAECNTNGDPKDSVVFSSKSGENFNHRNEWGKLDRSITGNHPFDYYPRGRVEIKNGKATIYLNPVLNKEDIVSMIMTEFGLTQGDTIPVCIKSDGSNHYRYTCEK